MVLFPVDLAWWAIKKWRLQNTGVPAGAGLVALLSLQGIWFQDQNQQKTLDNP